MVSVVSRYERNEIWIEYIYLPYFLSIKLPYFLGKYKCYTCSIKLKTLILIFGVFQSSTLFMDHQLQLYIQQSQAEHRECRKRIKLKKKKCWRARLELTRALTRDTCVFFWALSRNIVCTFLVPRRLNCNIHWLISNNCNELYHNNLILDYFDSDLDLC